MATQVWTGRGLVRTLAVSVAVWTVSCGSASAIELVYQGAFKLSSAFDWGGNAMAYCPEGDGGNGSLFVTGHVWYSRIGEAAIPTPVITSDPAALPEATTLMSPDVSPGSTGGLEYLPALIGQTSGKLYFGADGYGDKFGYCDLDITNVMGPYPLGGTDQRAVGHYISAIPQVWAATYVPGKLLVTGSGWGTYGKGPRLIAYNPISGGADLATTTLLQYDSTNPMPGYVDGDLWEASAWLDLGGGGGVALVAGTKVIDTVPEAAILIYEAADLAAVALGQMQQWEPEPTILSVQ